MMSELEVIRLTSLIGNPVKTAKGEPLGNIEEIAFSHDSERIVGVVLSPRDPARFGSKSFVIPWRNITLTAPDGIICIDADELETAPEDQNKVGNGIELPNVFIYTHSARKYG